MINQKKIGENIPNNLKETPYISCVVYVCNPDVICGGVVDVVRQDVKNKCQYLSDIIGKQIYDKPNTITHFCDEINIPEKSIKEQCFENYGIKILYEEYNDIDQLEMLIVYYEHADVSNNKKFDLDMFPIAKRYLEENTLSYEDWFQKYKVS